MRWEDERFIKVYTRDTVDWCMLPWKSRSLFLLILRCVERSGTLELGKHGILGLATKLLVPPGDVPELEAAIGPLIEAGTLEIRDGVLTVPNYVKAQETRQSDVARQRRCRERKRIVTSHHAASHAVTTSHAASPAVTNHHDQTRSDQNRTEEIRSEQRSDQNKDLVRVTAHNTHSKKSDKKARSPTSQPAAMVPADPLPYTVGNLLSSLAQGSGGRIAISPCTEGHAVRITEIIRELHNSHQDGDSWQAPTLEEWHEVGRYIRARWSADIDLGPAWAATGGKLADALAKARRWVAAGRPALVKGHGVPVEAGTPLKDADDLIAEMRDQFRRANPGEEPPV